MHPVAGQARDKPGVDSAESEFPFFSTLACSRHIVKNPFHLCGTEIGVDYQSCFLLNHIGITLFAKPVAIFRGASVLPHDGIVDRLACVGVPHYCRFSLISDTDGRYVVAVDAYFGNRFGYHRSLRAPDVVRIMLHPS